MKLIKWFGRLKLRQKRLPETPINEHKKILPDGMPDSGKWLRVWEIVFLGKHGMMPICLFWMPRLN
jgi:hypothetical protein